MVAVFNWVKWLEIHTPIYNFVKTSNYKFYFKKTHSSRIPQLESLEKRILKIACKSF